MPANGFVRINAVASAEALKNCGFFVVAIRGNQNCIRLADDFLGQIAKNALRAAIPTPYPAIEILADDCVVACFDDSGEP